MKIIALQTPDPQGCRNVILFFTNDLKQCAWMHASVFWTAASTFGLLRGHWVPNPFDCIINSARGAYYSRCNRLHGRIENVEGMRMWNCCVELFKVLIPFYRSGWLPGSSHNVKSDVVTTPNPTFLSLPLVCRWGFGGSSNVKFNVVATSR